MLSRSRAPAAAEPRQPPPGGDRLLPSTRFPRGAALVLLLGGLALGAGAQEGAPVAVLPITDGADVEAFFQLDLGNGSVAIADRLERDPLQVRRRRLRQNLFELIGRPTDQPAAVGEVLLGPVVAGDGGLRAAFFVETSTGYAAFLEEIGRNGQAGELTVTLGRPFAPLATRDGNYALLMRRDDAGRTEGAYLYHAASGRARYYGGLRKLTADSTPIEIEGLPALSGRVAAAAIQSAREETTGYLVADGANGELTFFDLGAGNPARVTARSSGLDLDDVLPAGGTQATPQRLVMVPLQDRSDATRHVFVLDVASGAMALVRDLGARGTRASLAEVRGNYYEVLRGGTSTAARAVVAVPAVDGGETIGLWFLDSLTRSLVHVTAPASPDAAVLRRVAVGG